MMTANAHGARLVAGALCVVMLASCAGLPALDGMSPAIPRTAQVDPVPFHGQRDYQCGPASMAMVLQASGAEAEVDDLIPRIFLPGRQGSVQPEMLAVARRYGRVSYPVEGGMPALLTELAAGYPVIVLQNLSLPRWPMWHYAVVTAYDLDRGELTMHTGMDADSTVSLRRLENTWARSGHWAMVALPPGRLPAGIGPHEAIMAVHDFERVAGPSPALQAWKAITERWPESAMAWFARGNAHHAHDDTIAAIQAFSRSTELDPAMAPAWINLGQSHIALGHRPEGLAALRKAAAIDGPWQQVAQRALQDEMENTPE